MFEKNAVVNGVGGFVGFYQVIDLLEKGYRVVASDLPNKVNEIGEILHRKDLMHMEEHFGEKLGKRGRLKDLGKRIIFVPADLRKPEDLKNLFRVAQDYFKGPIQKFFHIAAIFDFAPPWSLFNEVNIKGTINALEAAKEASVEKVILWSSGSVYRLGSIPQTENQPIEPKSYYSKSKAKQEEIALSYQRKGMNIIILRPAAMYGKGSLYGTFIFLRMIASGRMPFIVGRPKFTTASVNVKDVVNAAEFLSSLPYEKVSKRFFSDGLDDSTIFNINDDTHSTLEEILFEVSRILKPTHNTRLWNIHVPLWLVRVAASWQKWLSKGYQVRPKLTKDSLDFIEKPSMMSNQKLKNMGYKLMYPNIKDQLEDLIKYYVKEGII